MQAFEDTPAAEAAPFETDARLEIVVAVARGGVIGYRNALPWRLPADLRRFRLLTTGHAILMGRKTWESIGRPLPGRQSIVVSREATWRAPGAEVAPSLDAALALVRMPGPVFCIGGGELYRLALPIAGRLHVTEIDAEFPGDAFFPTIDPEDWRESVRESHPPGEDVACGYAFVTYERRQP